MAKNLLQTASNRHVCYRYVCKMLVLVTMSSISTSTTPGLKSTIQTVCLSEPLWLVARTSPVHANLALLAVAVASRQLSVHLPVITTSRFSDG